jgi:hypothetical protein
MSTDTDTSTEAPEAADALGTAEPETTGADVVPDEVAAQMEAEEAQAQAVPAPIADARPPGRQIRVFLCDRGHRTDALWTTPSTCRARPTRHGPECGHPLYPISALPEQVQKALNPLKASKKASKK